MKNWTECDPSKKTADDCLECGEWDSCQFHKRGNGRVLGWYFVTILVIIVALFMLYS